MAPTLASTYPGWFGVLCWAFIIVPPVLPALVVSVMCCVFAGAKPRPSWLPWLVMTAAILWAAGLLVVIYVGVPTGRHGNPYNLF